MTLPVVPSVETTQPRYRLGDGQSRESQEKLLQGFFLPIIPDAREQLGDRDYRTTRVDGKPFEVLHRSPTAPEILVSTSVSKSSRSAKKL